MICLVIRVCLSITRVSEHLLLPWSGIEKPCAGGAAAEGEAVAWHCFTGHWLINLACRRRRRRHRAERSEAADTYETKCLQGAGRMSEGGAAHGDESSTEKVLHFCTVYLMQLTVHVYACYYCRQLRTAVLFSSIDIGML